MHGWILSEVQEPDSGDRMFFHFPPDLIAVFRRRAKITFITVIDRCRLHPYHRPLSRSPTNCRQKNLAGEWNSNPAHICWCCWRQRLQSWNFCLLCFSSPSSVQVRRSGMVKVNKFEDKWVACGRYMAYGSVAHLCRFPHWLECRLGFYMRAQKNFLITT